ASEAAAATSRAALRYRRFISPPVTVGVRRLVEGRARMWRRLTECGSRRYAGTPADVKRNVGGARVGRWARRSPAVDAGSSPLPPLRRAGSPPAARGTG